MAQREPLSGFALRALGMGLLAGLAIAGPAQAAFPGHAGRIAFLDAHDRVMVANPDGTGVVGPLNPSDTPASAPHWSPDGTSLVVALTTTAAGYTTKDVVVLSADGTTARRVTSFDPSKFAVSPTWTPDGNIDFTLTDASFVASGIWTVAADGTGLHQLTTGTDFDVAVAPNGSVAFTRFPAAGPGSIYEAGADGSAPHALVAIPDVQLGGPAWSPDSATVAFDAADPVADTAGGIYVIGADGTGQHRIVGNGLGSRPAYSPDGLKIAFAMPNASQVTGIGVMSPDGSSPTLVVPPTGSSALGSPDWGVGAAVAPVPTPVPQGPKPLAPTVSGDAVKASIGLTTATLSGFVNPNGSPITSCEFLVTPAAPGPIDATIQRCQPTVGTAPVSVTASFLGLVPGTQYRASLTAAGAGGQGVSNFYFATAVPPTVKAFVVTWPVWLAPGGPSATLTSIRKNAGYSAPIVVPSAGTMVVRWTSTTGASGKGAAVGRAARDGRPATATVLARGSHRFAGGDAEVVSIKLTPAGKRLLLHARHVKVKATGQFSAAGHRALVVHKAFTLRG